MADRDQLEQELGEYFDETEPSWWRQRWPARDIVTPRDEGPMPPALWRQPYYPDQPPIREQMPWTGPPAEPPQLLREARLRALLDSPLPRWRGVIPGLVTGQFVDEAEPSEAPPIGAGYLRVRPGLGMTTLSGAPGPDPALGGGGVPPIYNITEMHRADTPSTRYIANLFGFLGKEGERTKGAGLRAGLKWAREDLFPRWQRQGVRRITFQPEEDEAISAAARVRAYEMATGAKAKLISPQHNVWEILLPPAAR
jgi:hypothetical protein